MWNRERPEMGEHLQLSGSALRFMANRGMDAFAALREVFRLGGRVSRIDLAIDLFDSGLTLAHLGKPHRLPYKGKGRTPKITPMGDEEDGWTLYVGSRSSDKFLRVYDKSKEQKLSDVDWVRIELECKGMVAHWLGVELPDKTPKGSHAFAATLIRSMVDFDNAAWTFALDSDEVQTGMPKQTERDTLKWLVDACAPALAKQIIAKPSEDILEVFWSALREELAKRGVSTE
jgi:hypothetical protein